LYELVFSCSTDLEAAVNDDSEPASKLIEFERAQIGHELHDGVMPLLFAASAVVSNVIEKLNQSGVDATLKLDQADLSPRLEQLSGWLDEALQASRRLLTDIYPPELEGRDWTTAVADALQRLFPERGNTIHWDVDPRVNDVEIGVACVAYRIVIESVRNAFRHGDATEVLVVSRRAAGSIDVSIRDDGKGFDPRRVSGNHYGLRVMLGRAELVRGTLEVDSQVGGPTVVALSVPVVASPL
jgi:signal transduction histidine kinase